MNMLDLRKTREIKLVDDGDLEGLFVIVPESADNEHPGYLMRADTKELAEEWVTGLSKARAQELENVASTSRPARESLCCFCWRPARKGYEERMPLVH